MNFKSKKNQAIDILDSHLIGLKEIQNIRKGNTWKASLEDSLNLYVGKDSSLANRLKSLHFTDRVRNPNAGAFSNPSKHVFNDKNKEHFEDLIQNAKSHIKSNGVFKDKNGKNFLSNFSNPEIIAGVVFIISTVVTIMFFINGYNDNREIVKLDSENKIYQDSLNTVKNDKQLLQKELKSKDSLYQILENKKQQPTSVTSK